MLSATYILQKKSEIMKTADAGFETMLAAAAGAGAGGILNNIPFLKGLKDKNPRLYEGLVAASALMAVNAVTGKDQKGEAKSGPAMYAEAPITQGILL